MKFNFFSTIVILFFVNIAFASYTETRFYRNCNNFEYPVDISFSGRLEKVPEIGHSYEATYDSKNNFRLVSVKHYFNGKHLPVYNFSQSDYYGSLIEYSLVSTVVFNYDLENRISAIEMKNLKNDLCHNKWGTAQYIYQYENQSSFDCNEYRYYIDYSDNQKLIKKPISLQIHYQFHLEHQLLENKYWQRKNWVVSVSNYFKEYLLFHPNGEPKSVRHMRYNKINYKLDLGASGYDEYIYNKDAIQIEVNTFSSDSKLYGTMAKIKTSVDKGPNLYTFKTLAYTSENRCNENNWNNQQEELDLTFLPVKSFRIDSTGVESFFIDEYSNGYIRSRQIVKEDDAKTRSNDLNKAVVAAKKTFFYSMPDEGTKKGVFCITGDTIMIEKSQSNFVYATFTNKYNGKVTSGWLKLDELEIIQTNPFNGYIVTDSMINYKNVLKEAALVRSFYNSEGLLQEVTRKNSRNEIYEDRYVPFKEQYTYFWNENGLLKLDSMIQKNWFKKVTNPLEDSIEIIRTKYDEIGFFREKETRIIGLENQIIYIKYKPNSFLSEEKHSSYNQSHKYSLIEGSNFYTEIDSTFYYNDLNRLEKVTFERIGKNFFPVEEIKLRNDYETEKLVGDYYDPNFSIYMERNNFTKSKRKFDKNGRLIKLQYFIENGDSLEILYSFKDLPNDFFSYEGYNLRPSEMELRRNDLPSADDNGIQKFFFKYDKNLNRTMKYCMKVDGSIIQSGGYGDLDYFFSTKMQDQLTDNLIIPKFVYNQNGMVSKVSFWKNDAKSIAYDNAGIHLYEFTYDNNLNAFSIIAKDENTNERKDDNRGVSEKCYFRDVYGNETHSLTKNSKGEILENEISIKEYSGYNSNDDKLISEKHFKIENNRLLKTDKEGIHQTILRVINSPKGNKILISSYKDKDGKLVKKNGVTQIRVVTDPYDWQKDTLSISYYNDKGYVSEEKRFENLADSVFFEGKGWVKEAMMEMIKETFPNLSTGYKKEKVYYNSKGKPSNNEYGFARSIICDSLPFYKYEKYYSENGKLAYKGDAKKEFFIKGTSPKEFVTKQVFLNDNSQKIKNDFGVSSVLSKMYWIKGVRVIENSYFGTKENKKVCDKNGVHKVIYYLNNSFFDVVDDTLAFICFDKKNKVVSNELGSIVNLFGDRFYNSPIYKTTSYNLDSALIVETAQGSLLLDTIELNKSYSKFKFIYTGNGCYIDKNLKLIQEGSNKEFKLIKSVGVPMSKDTFTALEETAKEFDENGNLSFYLYFEPLPKNKANYKFVENIYSESAWNSKGYTISIPEK
jgi:hypothetical protein